MKIANLLTSSSLHSYATMHQILLWVGLLEIFSSIATIQVRSPYFRFPLCAQGTLPLIKTLFNILMSFISI